VLQISNRVLYYHTILSFCLKEFTVLQLYVYLLAFSCTTFSFKVKYLAEYGGSDCVDTVSRIMKAVMITNLARQYNLTGTKQKRKLDGLHVINILFSRLFCCFMFKCVKKPTFAVNIHQWIKKNIISMSPFKNAEQYFTKCHIL